MHVALQASPTSRHMSLQKQKLRQQLCSDPTAAQQRLVCPLDFHVYAIGDNPKSDMRGANAAGEHWSSILVRTGIWEGGDNDLEDPADHVVPDVLAAVNLILRSSARSRCARCAGGGGSQRAVILRACCTLRASQRNYAEVLLYRMTGLGSPGQTHGD